MLSSELIEQVVLIPNKTAKLIKQKNKAIVKIFKNNNLYPCLVIPFISVYRARNFLAVVGIFKYEEEKGGNLMAYFVVVLIILICLFFIPCLIVKNEEIKDFNSQIESLNLEKSCLIEEKEQLKIEKQILASKIKDLEKEIDNNSLIQEIYDIKQTFSVLETELKTLHSVIRKLRNSENEKTIKIVEEIREETNKFENSPYYSFSKYKRYLDEIIKDLRCDYE